MLQNTFCHIPYIGPKSESRLWTLGFLSWDMIDGADSFGLTPSKEHSVRSYVSDSIAHLQRGDADYFYRLLPTNQQWRLFVEFRDSVAYLDIETTGLGTPEDYITTIAVYDGSSVHTFIHNDNLLDFRDCISEYRLLVTYNGKGFDLPFIRTYLRIPMDQAHIDLRHVLRSVGYRGGLKGCERQMGLDRGELEGVDGYFAVLLWFDYLRSDNPKALETLLAYNVQDVLNLEPLMINAYNLKIQQTPFSETHRLEIPPPPQNPFTPDGETIERIRWALEYGTWGHIGQ